MVLRRRGGYSVRMAGFGAYQSSPVLRQLTARFRRPSTTSAVVVAPAEPFKPRGRPHYADDTPTVVGRTLTSPNGMFRIAELTSFRSVPQVEPRERARDAALMALFTAGRAVSAGD